MSPLLKSLGIQSELDVVLNLFTLLDDMNCVDYECLRHQL